MRHAAPLIGLTLVVACNGEPEQGEAGEAAARGDSKVGGDVVATVDGEPITVARVREVVRETGLPPREAARRLEEQVLLAREARRRGYADDPQVRYGRKKAAVQALLAREIEEAITPESIEEERIREVYDEHGKEHWARPERRASVHVLAKMGADVDGDRNRAGRRFAARVLHELALADDPEEVIARYRNAAGRPFEVVVEEIPPQPRDASFADAYLEAVFGTDGPGVVSGPVRTRFGWHAIRVTEIEPAREGTLEEVADDIRSQLVRKRRKARLVELVRELRRRIPVEERPDAIATTMRSSLGAENR